MKFFITGGTGKVGSRFVSYLINKGHEVKLLVRDLERAQFLKDQGAELFLGELSTHKKLVEGIKGTDVIVHLAAQFRGVSEEVAWSSNVDGTVVLAKAALEAEVKRFVFSSTSLVYTNIRHEEPCREEDELNPAMLYPQTKVAAENELLKLQQEQGLDLRIVRFAFVYGDKDPHIEEFAPMMKQWNPKQSFSLIHHDDICQSLLLAAKIDNIASHIYNVADEKPTTVEELLTLNKIENDTPLADVPEADPFGMILNTAKIKTELGFQAKYPSSEAAMNADAL